MTDLELLKGIGIDTEEGLAFCADDPEFYEEMLEEYISESDEKINSLEGHFKEKDWANYGICAHSMKSTSRMIGAKDFSVHALEMEMAAKEGNAAAIEENHIAFLDEYQTLISSLRNAVR